MKTRDHASYYKLLAELTERAEAVQVSYKDFRSRVRETLFV